MATLPEHGLIVIAAGSAGLPAAPFAARFGAKLELIERNLRGGDGLYAGCVSSETLIKVAGVAGERTHRGKECP